MKKTKKYSEILFTAGILAFIALVAVLTLVLPADPFSLFESRAINARATLTVEGVLEGTLFDATEAWLEDEAAGRTTLLRSKAWEDLYLWRRPVVNDVVVTDGQDLLAYLPHEPLHEDWIRYGATVIARDLADVQQQVEAYGGTFLYVMVPSHYAWNEDKYPDYLNNYSDFTRVEMEAMRSTLTDLGVHYLDIGLAWEAEGHPAFYFSNVDHHYTWDGAFDTYLLMMQELKRLSGESLRVYGLEDLITSTVPNPFLGSRSRKLCGLWESSERLVIAEPKEPVPYVRYDWGSDEPSAAGLFALPEDTWSAVQYTMYMGGDISETVFRTGRPELPDMLFIGDSFTNPIETILYLSFDETRTLDLRYDQEMTLPEYIDTYRPQYVVLLRDYENLLSREGNGNLK